MSKVRKGICFFLFFVMLMTIVTACSQNEKTRDSISVDQLNKETIQNTMNHYEEITAETTQLTAQYLDENGFVSPENLETVLQELSDYAQELYEKGSITDFAYKTGDTCVYMEVDGWLSVLCSPPIAEFMSNGSNELEIITIEPNATEFYINYTTSGSKGPDEAATRIASKMNRFTFAEDLENSEVTIETFKNLPQKSIIIYNGHGGYNAEVGSVLFTGIDAWDQSTILLYTLEFGDKAIGVNDDGEFYLTSVFFDKYVEENAYDGSLFYLGACNSCTDSRLAQSIWDKGARGIVCNTQATWKNYNFQMTYSFFEGMTTQDGDGNYLTISQAVDYAKEQNGKKDPFIFGYGSEVVAFYRDDFTLQDMTAPAECEYNLASDCALTVYDENEMPYGDYTIQISGTQFLQGPMLSSESMTYESTEVITSIEPYILRLEPGVYTFTFIDNANPTLVETFTASIGGNDGKTSLSVYTEFAAEPEAKELPISKDEQYKINIFLSNFSEQWFHELYEWDEENNERILVSDKFEIQTADVMELVDFAWLYAKINMNATEYVLYEGYPYYGVDIGIINSVTRRFFGKSIDAADIQTGEMIEYVGYDTIVIDGKVCHPAADGETYNNMTVAEKMYDLGDGTFQVQFRIYSIQDIGGDDSIVLGAGTVQDKSVYYFTPDEADAHRYFDYYLSGVAIIQPYTTDSGKETYQLVSYELKSENVYESDLPVETTDPMQSNNSISVTVDDLVGNWAVDTELTMDYNGMSMNDMFGRPYSDGMTFKENGEFEFFITFDGGNGQYQIADGGVAYNVITWYDQNKAGIMQVQVINDTLYLLHQVGSYTVYWKKV